MMCITRRSYATPAENIQDRKDPPNEVDTRLMWT